ncbi:MAG: hypothetical protein M1508_12545 [Nitrospirae bacterium]|nr:hypothetical protein [Nitrospirota bacterium]
MSGNLCNSRYADKAQTARNKTTSSTMITSSPASTFPSIWLMVPWPFGSFRMTIASIGWFLICDDYNKHIQVWQVDTDTFCAVVRYQGSFVTDDGPSPGNTDTIAAGITGTFEGGYRAIITGTLNPSPTYRTKGNIGTFDYGCDVDTDPGDYSSCTGIFRWVGTYFAPGYFTYDWWVGLPRREQWHVGQLIGRQPGGHH